MVEEYGVDSGDDQVGALDIRVAVCADGGVIGGGKMAAVGGAGMDCGVHGSGAVGRDGV